jgi:hypothetical protein
MVHFFVQLFSAPFSPFPLLVYGMQIEPVRRGSKTLEIFGLASGREHAAFTMHNCIKMNEWLRRKIGSVCPCQRE